jgi:steroid delta-isomerase-like uncharacterized protein
MMSAQADESTPAVELVRRSFELFNCGNIDACVDLLRPDFVANIAGASGPTVGRDPWKQNALMFRTAFPNLRAEIEDIFGVGDRVAVRLTFCGTHRGTFFGLPATGREVVFSSVEIYRVADNQLTEEWVAPDIASLMGQLGASGG